MAKLWDEVDDGYEVHKPLPQAPKPVELWPVAAYGRLEKEYREPYTAWKTTPSPQTRGALLRAVQPTIDQQLRLHIGQHKSPVLQGRAKLLASQALDNYDPKLASLRSHLGTQLKRLRREIHKQQIVRVPELLMQESRTLADAAQDFLDEHGREPSAEELADMTGVSLKRIARARAITAPVAQSQFFSGGEIGDEDDAEDSLAVENPDLWRDYAELLYVSSPGRDQVILEHTLGLHGARKLSNQALAKKLGVSPGAVSQRKAKLQAQLQQAQAAGLLS